MWPSGVFLRKSPYNCMILRVDAHGGFEVSVFQVLMMWTSLPVSPGRIFADIDITQATGESTPFVWSVSGARSEQPSLLWIPVIFLTNERWESCRADTYWHEVSLGWLFRTFFTVTRQLPNHLPRHLQVADGRQASEFFIFQCWFQPSCS